MIVSYEDLTNLTGKTYRTIRRRIKTLDPVKKEGNRIFFDSEQALPLVYASAQPSIEDDDNLDLAKEKALESRERRRKLQRENDLEDGKIAPLQLITDVLADTASQVVSHLEALPLEMKKRNPKLTGHDIETVKKCIARCRNACAEIETRAE